MQEQFVVTTTLRPRRYRARYLECAIQGPTARQDADEAEQARWIQVLADMLKATHTSMGQLLSTSTKLGVGRTVSTLRSRVRVLRRFHLVVGFEPPASVPVVIALVDRVPPGES